MYQMNVLYHRSWSTYAVIAYLVDCLLYIVLYIKTNRVTCNLWYIKLNLHVFWWGYGGWLDSFVYLLLWWLKLICLSFHYLEVAILPLGGIWPDETWVAVVTMKVVVGWRPRSAICMTVYASAVALGGYFVDPSVNQRLNVCQKRK